MPPRKTDDAPLTDAEIDNLKIHEMCELFPPASEDELAGMTEDIEAHGLREPITVLGRQWIVDGRTRYIAMRNGNVPMEPRHFRHWTGSDDELFAFVMSENLHRRHLTASDRAVLAQTVRDRLARKVPNARKEAARVTGASEGFIAAADQIKRTSPDVHERVRKGEITIPEAKRELGLDQPKGRTRIDGVEQDDPPDVAERRQQGRLPKGAIVDLRRPAEPTRLEDVQEDHAERAAIQDDSSDEEWAVALPLYAKLDGKPRQVFARDALAWRHLGDARKAWGDAVARAAGRGRSGPWLYRHVRALECGDPADWQVCGEHGRPGCGGTGKDAFAGECPECRGQGYVVV